MESTKARILVVDDVLANRKLAGKILAGEYEVDSVKSGEEALDFFTRKIPDLVLLDIHMEGIDGFEVLERMKAVPETVIGREVDQVALAPSKPETRRTVGT